MTDECTCVIVKQTKGRGNPVQRDSIKSPWEIDYEAI